jgi:hypothetical protein
VGGGQWALFCMRAHEDEGPLVCGCLEEAGAEAGGKATEELRKGERELGRKDKREITDQVTSCRIIGMICMFIFSIGIFRRMGGEGSSG